MHSRMIADRDARVSHAHTHEYTYRRGVYTRASCGARSAGTLHLFVSSFLFFTCLMRSRLKYTIPRRRTRYGTYIAGLGRCGSDKKRARDLARRRRTRDLCARCTYTQIHIHSFLCSCARSLLSLSCAGGIFCFLAPLPLCARSYIYIYTVASSAAQLDFYVKRACEKAYKDFSGERERERRERGERERERERERVAFART